MFIYKGETMNKQKQKMGRSNLTTTEILFPEKYAKLFLVFYIVLIPFLVGHLFLFTYISKFNFDIYTAICTDNSTLLTWCMGYEGFALFFFIVILVMSIKNVVGRAKK